jgi:acetoin utilization deacetylase AcuC-like enzyme
MHSDNLAYFFPEGHEAHYFPGHPERPERISAIRDALMKACWWDIYGKVSAVPVPKDVLYSVHNRKYLDTLELACSKNQWLDPDTYTKEASWSLCLQTAGGTLSITDLVWMGKVKKGFSLARPPGHHATRDWGMGFCLLNNVAIAVEYLFRFRGANRVAIIDLDLHHGNGTQDIFYRRGDVLFASLHQSPLYPLTGDMSEEGEGLGIGTNFNLPLPPGSGDKAYKTAVREIVIPLLDRFSPEIILVSFGYDAHWLDPLGSIKLSAQAFFIIFSELVDWTNRFCHGKLVIVLEGGYNLDAASVCSQAVVAALIGADWKDPIGPSPDFETSSWENVIKKGKLNWKL